MPTLKHLQALCQVEEKGSFSAAADALNYRRCLRAARRRRGRDRRDPGAGCRKAAARDVAGKRPWLDVYARLDRKAVIGTVGRR
jgi:hypothetical protein